MEASRAHEELALAESKLSAARAALQAGDNRQARMLAEQAELDARLAEARAEGSAPGTDRRSESTHPASTPAVGRGPVNMRFFLVMAALALTGCSSQDTEHELAQASAALERIQADGMVQRGAPKDLQRALETLQRAERFNDYWGAEDARHYAYLSRRYSESPRAGRTVAASGAGGASGDGARPTAAHAAGCPADDR